MNKPRHDTRILLVEDDSTNREVALRTLEYLGYGNVKTAIQGKQALEVLAAEDFDLVLMDCHLPEMDGYQATREIRNRASAVRNHDIPIVALTAAAMEGDRQRCLAAGMNGYVAKPLRFATLQEAITRFAPHAEPAAEPASVPPASEHVNASLFNGDVFIGSVIGSQQLARWIIRGFVDDMPRQIARLAQAVNDGDAPRVVLLAHSIKGAAAGVSGEEMREASGKVEQTARTGDLSAAADALRELSASFERSRQAMERFCAKIADES